MLDVEKQIRQAHLINNTLFILKILKEKILDSQFKIYLDALYDNIVLVKDEMKAVFKKYCIKLLAPDKDLVPIFIECENLVRSSFPYRALGVLCATTPELININDVLIYFEPNKQEDIRFVYNMVKDLLNQSEENYE